MSAPVKAAEPGPAEAAASASAEREARDRWPALAPLTGPQVAIAEIPGGSHFGTSDIRNLLARNGIRSSMWGSLFWTVYVSPADQVRATRILALRDVVRGLELASTDSSEPYLAVLREQFEVPAEAAAALKKHGLSTNPFALAFLRPPVLVDRSLSDALADLRTVEPRVAEAIRSIQTEKGWTSSDTIEWLIIHYVTYWATPAQQSTAPHIYFSVRTSGGASVTWMGEVWEENGVVRHMGDGG